MKKIGIILTLLSLLAMAGFAQEQEDLQVSIGVYGNANYWTSHETNGYISYDDNTLYGGGGVFLDLIYANLSVGYQTQLLSYTSSKTGGSYATTIYPNEHMGYLNLRGVLKYPFQLGSHFILFPMAGVEYSLFVVDDYFDQISQTAKSDWSDLYLVLGLGGDIFIGSVVYIRISADFDLNLTATPTYPYPGVTYSGYKVNAGVGLGFRL